jgi:hypothetical protein
MLLKKNIWLKLFTMASALVMVSCSSDDDIGIIILPDPIELLGEIDFLKTYGGSGEDETVSIVQANDGGFVVLGTTRSTDGDIIDKTGTDSDYWVLKLNSEGDKQWSKTYGGDEDDRATQINKTSDGGYIISGYSRSSNGDVIGNNGFHDFWIVKLNSTGDITWNQNFGFEGSDQAFDVFETSDGGYFASGFLDVTASGGQGNDGRGSVHGVGDFWGIKMDLNGDMIWLLFFGAKMNDRSYDALETADGGFLMVGASESNDFDITDDKGSYDYWAVKMNSDGDKVWTKSLGGSEIDVGFALTKTLDGNYILVGDARSTDKDVSSPIGNADAWAVKFSDNNGAIIWEKSYGGSAFDTARGISSLANGDFAITGSSRSIDGDLTSNKGENDIWLYTIDADGNLGLQMSIGGSSFDFSDQVIETIDNKLVVVGNTESNDFDIAQNQGIKDAVIIKIK